MRSCRPTASDLQGLAYWNKIHALVAVRYCAGENSSKQCSAKALHVNAARSMYSPTAAAHGGCVDYGAFAALHFTRPVSPL